MIVTEADEARIECSLKMTPEIFIHVTSYDAPYPARRLIADIGDIWWGLGAYPPIRGCFRTLARIMLFRLSSIRKGFRKPFAPKRQ